MDEIDDISACVTSSTDASTSDNLKERNFPKWLENKLSGDDRWNSRAAGSLLTAETLPNVSSCFIDCPAHLQVKILLGLLHLPKRTLETCCEHVDHIIDVALKEADEWIQTVALLIENQHKDHSFSTNNVDDDHLFTKTLAQLRTQLRDKCKCGEVSLIPLESSFVSNTISNNLWKDSITSSEKNFALKRRPKSASLRAELLQKSKDTSHQPKGKTAGSLYSSVLPLRAKSMAKKTDSSPLRGLPTMSAVKSSQGFSATSKTFNQRPAANVKKEGGVKFLEIDETPQALKIKRKQFEEQEKEQRRVQKEEARLKAQEEREARRKADKEQKAKAIAAYQEQAKKEAMVVKSIKCDPQRGQKRSHAESLHSDEHEHQPTTSMTPAYAAGLLPAPIPPAVSVDISIIRPPPPPQIRPIINPLSQYPPAPSQYQIGGPPPPQPPPAMSYGTLNPNDMITFNQGVDGQSHKVYSISKEVMMQAQDMFKTANKLSRPEKALILGFMAGNRENPCPQMGTVLTVRLSETREMANLPNDSNLTAVPVLSEIFFQMNYENGEWKRLKKMRPLSAEELLANPQSIVATNI